MVPAFQKKCIALTRLDDGDRLRDHRDDVSIEVKHDGLPAISGGMLCKGEADGRRGVIHAAHPDQGSRLGMLPVHRITAGQDKAG